MCTQSFESSYIHALLMMKNLLHILRWPNLLMLAGIQLLIYFSLLEPSASVMAISDVVLMIIITVILGAGGYVINDYYDAGIDQINRPDRWIAGNQWSLRTVKNLYLGIVFFGFILSMWLSIRLGLVKYIFIYPLAVTGLWFYSYALKCKPVIGNAWVSLFCAGVIGIIALPDSILKNTSHIKAELWYYTAFAFIATWLREMIKDIEDLEGDAKSGCHTAVVSFGLKAGKVMATIMGLLLIISLLVWDSMQANHWIKLILTVLQGFTVGALAFVWWAKNNTYYHHASTIIKLVMVGGTLILLML